MNIGLELLKVRSGPLMNDMMDRINKKSDCTYGKNTQGCDWINGLKYFVYSAVGFLVVTLRSFWKFFSCTCYSQLNYYIKHFFSAR